MTAHRAIIWRKISSSFYIRITGKWKRAKIRRFEYETVRGQCIRGVHSDSPCASSFGVTSHVSRYSKEKSGFGLLASLLHERYTTDVTTTQRDATQRTTRRWTLGSHSCMFVHTRINSNAARKSDRFQRYARPDRFEKVDSRLNDVTSHERSRSHNATEERKREKYFDENTYSGTKSIDLSINLPQEFFRAHFRDSTRLTRVNSTLN